MRLSEKRDRKHEPWNERAVRCVLEHLSTRVTGRDQLVLVHLARHAHPGGCGVRVGLRGLRDMTGYNRRTLMAARESLEQTGVLVRDGRGPAGVYRYRIELCQWCTHCTAARPCQRCSFNTAARRRRKPASGAVGAPEQKEPQAMPAATPVIPGSGPAAHSPNGDSRAGTDAGSRTPSGGRRQAADADGQQQGNPAQLRTVGALLRFKAALPDGGATVSAHQPQSCEAPGDATGDPVSNP